MNPGLWALLALALGVCGVIAALQSEWLVMAGCLVVLLFVAIVGSAYPTDPPQQ